MERQDPSIVLIPSPLNGPLVWAPVARTLRRHGMQSHVAVLQDDPVSSTPFWVQHAASAARSIAALPVDRPAILIAHSGAGPLLPAIAAFSPHPIAGYVFVDAGLPLTGQSRLDEIELTVPALGAELRQRLAQGGRFPEWTEEEAREVLPHGGLRHGILAELRPRGQAFFIEIFPAFPSWPDAPCAYLRFSDAYHLPAMQAHELGWVCRDLPSGHFHMVVDPEGVAAVLLDLITALGTVEYSGC